MEIISARYRAELLKITALYWIREKQDQAQTFIIFKLFSVYKNKRTCGTNQCLLTDGCLYNIRNLFQYLQRVLMFNSRFILINYFTIKFGHNRGSGRGGVGGFQVMSFGNFSLYALYLKVRTKL